MSGKTSIEWTEQTWNPIVGCSIVSPGCTNCYAMKMAARIEAMGNQPRYAGTTRKVNGKAVWTGKLVQAPDSAFLAPLKRKKPTTYFVNSMGDLFHEDCPDEWIDRVFAVMALSPQHTFQVLTKRAGRMREYMTSPDRKRLIAAQSMPISCLPAADGGHQARIKLDHFSACFAGAGPFPNIWLGVSTERQQEADERIPLLLQTPAAVWFISAEPLLGGLDLTSIVFDRRYGSGLLNALTGEQRGHVPNSPLGSTGRLDWVIAGGESGPAARPMHPDWARDLRDQCSEAGVPFFFKQWGEWAPGECADFTPTRSERIASWFVDEWSFATVTPSVSAETHHDDAPDLYRIGKGRAGRKLDGVEHNGFPQVSA